MSTEKKVESLIQQVAELPEYAQVELLQTLVAMRAEHLGIHSLDDDEPITAAL